MLICNLSCPKHWWCDQVLCKVKSITNNVSIAQFKMLVNYCMQSWQADASSLDKSPEIWNILRLTHRSSYFFTSILKMPILTLYLPSNSVLFRCSEVMEKIKHSLASRKPGLRRILISGCILTWITKYEYVFTCISCVRPNLVPFIQPLRCRGTYLFPQ